MSVLLPIYSFTIPRCWAPKPSTKARCTAMMKTPQSPGLGPPVRRRPQHAHRRTSRSHPPRGMTATRARPARRCAHAWGAVHVDTITEKILPKY